MRNRLGCRSLLRAVFLCEQGSSLKGKSDDYYPARIERGDELRSRYRDIHLDKTNRPSLKARSSRWSPDSHGHIQVMIDKKYYFVHRLAFMFMTGQLPPADKVVDHINGDNQDNRWCNLRAVTQSVNQQNRHRARNGCKSGMLGASWSSDIGMWRSEIMLDGKRTYLGRFATAEKAHKAYMTARAKHRTTHVT